MGVKMSKDQFSELSKKFEELRKTKKGKKIVYPVSLRKKTAILAQYGYPSKDLAKSFKISTASIKSWIKKYSKVDNIVPEDIIPVQLAEDSKKSTSNPISMRVVSLELEISCGELSQTLSQILHSHSVL